MVKIHMESREVLAKSQVQPLQRTEWEVKVQWTSFKTKNKARVLLHPAREVSSAALQWRAQVSEPVVWVVALQVTQWEQSTTNPTVQIIMVEVQQCSVATPHLNLNGRTPKACTLTPRAAVTWCTVARTRPLIQDQARWRHPIEQLKKHAYTCNSYSKLISGVK